MICVNENTLRVEVEPLKTLSSYRRHSVYHTFLICLLGQGKIIFGTLFAHDPESSAFPFTLSLSDEIEVLELNEASLQEKSLQLEG